MSETTEKPIETPEAAEEPIETPEAPEAEAAAAAEEAAPAAATTTEAEAPKVPGPLDEKKKSEEEEEDVKPHDKAFDKVNRLLDAAAEYLPEPLRNVYHKIDPVLDWILYGFIFVFPYIHIAVNYMIDLYGRMPNHSVKMIYGLLVCFMGAHFCCLVAVIEAFKLSGAGKKMKGFFLDIWNSFKKASEASKADDRVDADGDGVADVEQISDGELFIRKVKLVLREVDPLLVNKALTGLYQGVISAVCVVQFEFAKTITLGNSIGEFLYVTVDGLTRPFFEYILADYAKWVSLVINYVCKVIGSSIAWLAQFYASLFHCAIAGALTFSRALIAFTNEHGWTNIDTNESWIDEITGWILAAVSVVLQMACGTHLIFPFNIILIPFRCIEAFLKGAASSDAFGTAKGTGAAAANGGVPAQ